MALPLAMAVLEGKSKSQAEKTGCLLSTALSGQKAEVLNYSTFDVYDLPESWRDRLYNTITMAMSAMAMGTMSSIKLTNQQKKTYSTLQNSLVRMVFPQQNHQHTENYGNYIDWHFHKNMPDETHQSTTSSHQGDRH